MERETTTPTLDAECLATFVAFARARNLTRAAEARHLSQPAVHVQIKKLAEALGVPLYRRVGRRLELTAEGERVAAFGAEAQARTAEFVEQLRTGASRQPVVLAAGAGAYLYLLGDAIRAYARAAPAPLRLLTRDRDGALDALRAGVADLAVAPLESAEPESGLRAAPLVTVGQKLVVPARHPLARRRGAAQLRELAGAALVVPPPDRPHRAMLATHLRDAGVEWRVAVEAGGWELMLHFVRLGLGLAVVNACCRVPAGLVERPLPALPRTVYHAVHREGALRRRATAVLYDALRAHADAWRA